MTKDEAFVMVTLNIFAGVIGGVTVNLFSNNFTPMQLVLVMIVGCISYYLVNEQAKKEKTNNE